MIGFCYYVVLNCDVFGFPYVNASRLFEYSSVSDGEASKLDVWFTYEDDDVVCASAVDDGDFWMFSD